MERLEHLKLPVFKSELQRYKQSGGGGFENSHNRSRIDFGVSSI